MQLCQKRKILSEFLFAFSKLRFNFETFLKKDNPHRCLFFWTDGLQEPWLDKCPKGPVSEDRSASNELKGPKHCSKQNDSTISIFIDPC